MSCQKARGRALFHIDKRHDGSSLLYLAGPGCELTLSSTALLLTRCSGLAGSGQGASLRARDSVSGELSLDIVIVIVIE